MGRNVLGGASNERDLEVPIASFPEVRPERGVEAPKGKEAIEEGRLLASTHRESLEPRRRGSAALKHQRQVTL